MNNKRCSVDQRINGQRTYQRTTEVVPSSAKLLHQLIQFIHLRPNWIGIQTLEENERGNFPCEGKKWIVNTLGAD